MGELEANHPVGTPQGLKHRRPRWLGGYRRIEADGSETFIIEKKIRGKKFHASTRCHTERAALKQLERFEADPDNYEPAPIDIEALVMTADLVQEFGRHQLAAEVSKRHIYYQQKYLADWMLDLRGRDLRKLQLVDLKQALEGRPKCRQQRIAVIKTFHTWLREEKALLRTAEDATLDLPVPQSRPEKQRRRKAVDLDRVRAVKEHLPEQTRDALELLSVTGWHISELRRFARHGEVVSTIGRDVGEVIAVLVTLHKGKEHTRTPLRLKAHVKLAKRVRARGSIPSRLYQHFKEAAKAAEVAYFTPGVMRHTVMTWAVELGANPADVSQFVNHKDPRTAKKFYIDVGVPTVTVPTRRV